MTTNAVVDETDRIVEFVLNDGSLDNNTAMGGWFGRFRVGRTRFRPSQPPLLDGLMPVPIGISEEFSDASHRTGINST